MADIYRKVPIDKTLAAAGLKAKWETQQYDGKPTPFTRVDFEAKSSASKFVAQWMNHDKHSNGVGEPMYCRIDTPPEVRKFRAALYEIQKTLRKHFRTQQSFKDNKVQISWSRHTLTLNGKTIATRDINGKAVWQDEGAHQLYNSCKHQKRSAPSGMEVDGPQGIGALDRPR